MSRRTSTLIECRGEHREELPGDWGKLHIERESVRPRRGRGGWANYIIIALSIRLERGRGEEKSVITKKAMPRSERHGGGIRKKKTVWKKLPSTIAFGILCVQDRAAQGGFWEGVFWEALWGSPAELYSGLIYEEDLKEN